MDKWKTERAPMLMQQKFVFFKWEYFFPKSNNVTIVTIRKNAEVAAEKNEAAESNAANTLFLWYSVIGHSTSIRESQRWADGHSQKSKLKSEKSNYLSIVEKKTNLTE